MLYTKESLNTIVYDQYLDPSIMGNLINDNINFLTRKENIIIVEVQDNYKYRPELIALQYYGSEQFYPLILAANGVGSLLQFIPSRFNYQIKLIKHDAVSKILGI